MIYLDHIQTFLPGLNLEGEPNPLRSYSGITVLNDRDFVSALDAHGIKKSLWDQHEFRRHVENDIARWLSFQLRNNIGSRYDKDQIRLKLFDH